MKQCALPFITTVVVTTDALSYMLAKSVSCYRITVVISKSAHCFHDS